MIKKPATRQIRYRPPVEAVEGAQNAPVKTVGRDLAIAYCVALLLGSHALLNWTNNLPIGNVSDFLLFAAENWQKWMDAIGASAFGGFFRSLLRAIESLR